MQTELFLVIKVSTINSVTESYQFGPRASLTKLIKFLSRAQ